jgi:hypothetical protein
MPGEIEPFLAADNVFDAPVMLSEAASAAWYEYVLSIWNTSFRFHIYVNA